MELLNEYMTEIAIGGSSTFGALIITILKKAYNRMNKIEDRIMELEKKIEINTALDRERAKRN